MAAYKDIKGTQVPVVSSDLGNPVKGQIWYNTTSQLLKGQVFVAAAWATANNATTARYSMAGTGTQTAQLSCAGETPPGSPNSTNNTEEYDGTNWTNVGS